MISSYNINMQDTKSVKNFETDGFVYVDYPSDLNKEVKRVVENWKDFCDLPEAARIKFPYNEGTGEGFGYELKKTPGSNLDLKENFHFTLKEKAWLKDAADKTGEEKAVKFITGNTRLIELMKPLVVDFAEKVEKEFNIKNFAKDVADSQDTWCLRFLHYFGNRNTNEIIANPHADKGGITLHLYESGPGVERLDKDKKWQSLPVSETETVIIPGMRMQYRSNNKIKALCHRVMATPETAQSGRFSMVCFIDFLNTPKYNKSGMGRMQEFAPGFNYDMPFEDFKKLFV